MSHQRLARLAWIGAFLGVLGLNQAGGCVRNECPEREPFESGNYEIIGLTYDFLMPEDQWLVNTVVGAQVTVDREAGEVTISYIKDGTTYQVHYTIEGS
jgi:hypothetical protein